MHHRKGLSKSKSMQMNRAICPWAAGIFVMASAIGCSAIKTYYAVNYGIGVSSDRWIGVYQLPIQDQVGIVVTDLRKVVDSVESTEGTFSQRAGDEIFRGRFALVRLTHTTYVGGVPRHQVSNAGQTIIDLGVASAGLLGPGRPDVYGPGIHADATGRPFPWRTDDGQMAFGPVKANAYGLGVGMDQFGRPVRATALW